MRRVRAGLTMAGLLVAGAILRGQTTVPVVRRPPEAPVSDERPLPEAQGDAKAGAVPVIRVETRLVNVAVNVEDGHGTTVGGLTRESFAVSEDGKAQKIAVFERESAAPLSIVLLIDASETVLTNERLEREAAKHFVRALLREQDELDLMEFADTVRELVPFTNQRKRIEAGLGEIQHGDETALYDGILLASQRLGETKQEAAGGEVVVLITDGGDSKHGSTYTQALEQAQRAGAIVYSIIIVPIASDAGRNTGGEHALMQMTADTGGKYYYVEDPRDLEPAFAHISDDLRTQYVLGYYAPQAAKDAGFRRIGVRLTNAGLAGDTLRYRAGYYAEAAPR